MMIRIFADLTKSLLNALAVCLAVGVLMVSGVVFMVMRKRS